MNAIIKGGLDAEINDSQTQIKFDGEWYDILEDMEGEHIFMYENKAIYFNLNN